MTAVATTATLLIGLIQARAANGAGIDEQRRMLRIANATRARHDLRLLRLDRELSRDSMVHTRIMVHRTTSRIRRTSPGSLVEYEWDDLGAHVVGVRPHAEGAP